MKDKLKIMSRFHHPISLISWFHWS